MDKTFWWPLCTTFLVLAASLGSCKHEPFLAEDDDITPIDTTANDDQIDTTGSQQPCDPEVVYFQLQILPILQSNCAISGCHDAATAEEKIILDSYANVMASDVVKAGDPSDSDLYEVLTEDDADKRMPPPPRNRLNEDQIKWIADWISQGADNLECDSEANGGCNTTDVSFAVEVGPVITNYCQGCHNATTPSGGVKLNGYENIKPVAQSGRLVGVISWQQGYPKMPQGGDQLSQCTIDQISAWVADGAKNN